MKETHRHTKGITALVAIMIMTISLTLGVGIFQILFTEMLASRDQAYSAIAEYAAESGIECAKYNIYTNETFPIDQLWCNGTDLSATVTGNTRTYAHYEMTQSGACAEVTISDQVISVDSPVPNRRLITIQSRGRYPCTNPRVERGIVTSIQQGL